jgi:hypothetical protein
MRANILGATPRSGSASSAPAAAAREPSVSLSTPTGNRTPVSWLRTRYPRPLDDGGKTFRFCQSTSRSGGTRTPNRRFWRPVLYQLSYGPIQWPGAESNRRHHDFQSCALPTELPGQSTLDQPTHPHLSAFNPASLVTRSVARTELPGQSTLDQPPTHSCLPTVLQVCERSSQN